MNNSVTDTIAAIATPPGKGGVGIVRISGPDVTILAKHISNKPLKPRQAIYSNFYDTDGSVIDSGILIFFPAPSSFTGEDVLELQGHGGTIVLNMVLKRVLELGARLANPGEFSQRAFLNNKIDLTQAEAVADLIESETEQSARSAQLSLQGKFSELIHQLVTELTEIRIYIEAAIDFVDEEIDFLSDGIIENRIIALQNRITETLATAKQGRLLREGISVVLAGKPNSGKSSLLNALTGYDTAIVTEIAGTTRDTVKEQVQLDGMPLHIIDTAGLRESEDIVEQEGIRRAQDEIRKADVVLLIIDAEKPEHQSVLNQLPSDIKLTKIYNKIDLIGIEPEMSETENGTQIYLSVKTGQGMNLLEEHLKKCVGFNDSVENVFISRRRHINALSESSEYLKSALTQLQNNYASELVAEDLRQAQNRLGEITGEISSDELLGKIFSSFCIGK